MTKTTNCKLFYLTIIIGFIGCNPKENTMYKIETISSSDKGHMLHHNSSFDSNDQWLVFDTRNDETKIGQTGEIGIVNIETKEEKIIYLTNEQSVYGPGVGAASFHPQKNRIIFIHGLLDAHRGMPYGPSRRFGMMVDLKNPLQGIPADSRDVTAPYLPGTLRGGSHSHCWSEDGEMISFTYNDEFVNPELRTVGVMIKPERDNAVDHADGNIQGQYFSAIVAQVVSEPVYGTDQISKAFDECWLSDPDRWSNPTIVFQGTTKNKEGGDVIEIFKVEIDRKKILQDNFAVGKEGEPVGVPKGILAKRLTHSVHGLSDIRHWLRSSPDGKFIYALVKDTRKFNQIARCNVATGELTTISNLDFSIDSPINIDPKGQKIVFVSGNNIYLFDLKSRKAERITDFSTRDPSLIGVPVFSRKGSLLAFNQFVDEDGRNNVQIKIVRL